jgi:hypothetical protein
VTGAAVAALTVRSHVLRNTGTREDGHGDHGEGDDFDDGFHSFVLFERSGRPEPWSDAGRCVNRLEVLEENVRL